MKKVRRILVITIAAAVVMYLGLAHGLALFSATKAPAKEGGSLNIEDIETKENELPPPSSGTFSRSHTSYVTA